MTIINQTHALVDVAKIKQHPNNPRRGDVAIVAESIKQNGFFGALIVQQSTGYVLAGNHRLMAAQVIGMSAVPVIYVDVDDTQAMRILLADNRTSDLAVYNNETLAELLDHLQHTDDGLIGTGYTDDDLASLLDGLLDGLQGDDGDLDAEPDESPQLGGLTYKVIVTFDNEDDQADLMTELEERGLEVAVGCLPFKR